MPADFELINEICAADIEELAEAEKSYGDSWKLRGGVGAFMMLARKWDRIENQCREKRYDVFEAIAEMGVAINSDGIIDDIRDLRRYLLLVEQHMVHQCAGTAPKLFDSGKPTSAYVNQDPPLPVTTGTEPAY